MYVSEHLGMQKKCVWFGVTRLCFVAGQTPGHLPKLITKCVFGQYFQNEHSNCGFEEFEVQVRRIISSFKKININNMDLMDIEVDVSHFYFYHFIFIGF